MLGGNVKKSERLKRMIAALRTKKEVSTFKLMKITKSCAVHSDIADLRRNGLEVKRRYKGKIRGRQINTYELIKSVRGA